MNRKYPSNVYRNRQNLYLKEEDKALFDQAAAILKQRGHDDVYDKQGRPNKTEIVRQLLKLIVAEQREG